ncbi:DUF1801 domain-containing protein [Undibacterium fentianense]|uniref:DUF1801 domain-containing protein n=1 Tax=Undibacterium fentianense TaxID=2828728 RepID=A0A941E2F4_9BURK|nr:DUF1801 domain-containing protein [Undibacterium fentianense]MBR7801110.1 DUF1801 domain-containing protein [Undibacterium fentianense]
MHHQLQDERVQGLLDDLRLTRPDHYTLVQAVRQIILDMAPGIVEEVKYGGILFGILQPFCGVFVYSNHITIEFSDGAKLPDQFGMLAGQGKLRRHIKLNQLEDVSIKQLPHFIELASHQNTCDSA